MKNVIAIFDVGKTNKKLFLFDEDYNIVFERSARFNEIIDEDGDPCENVAALRSSLFESLDEVLAMKEFSVKAINYSAYGASWVYLDEKGNVTAPLYNYLKKYPEALHKQFYSQYGDEAAFSNRTASPVLGSLNSGLQLYRIKYEKPILFRTIHYALHLPQFLSYLLTGKPVSDITSIGSHTGLWNFTLDKYDEWVEKEGIKDKLAPIHPHSDAIKVSYNDHVFFSGIGLHDSSAALIPYLVNFNEPFILLSTGTWSITLNPFNHTPLTAKELENDCLCYLTYEGKPVKASRLFAGYEHDEQVKLISAHFQKPLNYYKQVGYDPRLIAGNSRHYYDANSAQPDLKQFENFEEAYHYFMLQLVKKQFASSGFVMTESIRRIFVDGGFSKNPLYMNMLASLYPGRELYAATMAQSTSLGAALSIHKIWNNKPVPRNIIELNFYSSGAGVSNKK
jgi:sugar (pentulose or hexulose) kinase